MESEIIKTSLPDNVNYGGWYQYLETTKNGKTQKICFIESFISDDLREAYRNLLLSIRDAEKRDYSIDFQKRITAAKKDISEVHENFTLPEIKMPPPPM